MATSEHVEKIAQLGDLVLQIGTSEKKILVSSTVLINLSKVFAVLLGPNFKEGQTQRDATNPQTISLPDDDATAMTHMCMLLHCKVVPEFSNPGGNTTITQNTRDNHSLRILKLAMIIDKYDCVDVLRLQVNSLVWDNLDRFRNGGVATCRIANVAWMFQLPRAFRAATKQIIREHAELPSLNESGLPMKVYCSSTYSLMNVQHIVPHR
ncbi:hypothetical protein HII31_01063 [Pseudocercospora fuligena]|uniref:BTB domain-containing protein n=1 Tax=Pseudocercospora fuligena TaxID=685502 RepID=A0A8H6VMS7_9PEZI|nr:hypothetical protein HII31_01063 [Pseudocercospora fuligena]